MALYWMYILCSKPYGTLYVGVTNDLVRRVYEHKQKLIEGFTKLYGIDKLVYFEQFNDSKDAIHREKCIKKWNRSWKINLIEQSNANWQDLYFTIIKLMDSRPRGKDIRTTNLRK